MASDSAAAPDHRGEVTGERPVTSLRASVIPDVLIAANRANVLETVLRWMVHDLRSPAQSLAFIPAMAEDRSSQGDRSWLEALGLACDRLAVDIALIDRLVGDAGPPQPAGPVALEDVLRFVGGIVSARRGSLKIEVSPRTKGSTPAVSAVRRDLETALLNLILNAGEAGAREIRITVVTRPDAVDLLVEDDGPGVPDPIRPRLFEPFATTRSDGPDRGLGLYAARHLVARSGGSLWFEPGQPRDRFIVRLPVWRPARSP